MALEFGCWDGGPPLNTTMLLYYILVTVTMWVIAVLQLTPVLTIIGRLSFRNEVATLLDYCAIVDKVVIRPT